MKTNLLSITLLLTISSCASKDDPAPTGPSIVGSWHKNSVHATRDYQDETVFADVDYTDAAAFEAYLIFAADGTLTDTALGADTKMGTYQLKGKSLTLSYDKYMPSTSVIEEVTANRLVYTYAGTDSSVDSKGNSYPYRYVTTYTLSR